MITPYRAVVSAAAVGGRVGGAVTGTGQTAPGGGDVPSLTIVCLPRNDDALTAGLAAAHSVAARSGRVVICMSEPSPFGAVLGGDKALLDDVEGRLTIFEVIEEACVPGRIREDLDDQLARALHRSYVQNCAARGDSPHVNKSMRPWEQLPDDLKRSNLAQAADIGRKLGAIGCAVTRSRRMHRISRSGTARSNCWPNWSTSAGCRSGRRRVTCRARTVKASSIPT